MTSLCGSQPSSVVFACKTASFWSELKFSTGPRLCLVICACETARLAPELLISKGPRPHLSFCACKTTWLASELLVSMGASPHLWFLHAKQRLLDQNYKSLSVPDFPKIFRIQNSAFCTKISSLYWSQRSSVVFAFKTATFRSELRVSIGPRPHLSFCECKTAWLAPELLVSIGSRLYLSFCACKTSWLASE